MNNQFDELTKQMAQSVTRRAALKKFGVGLAGMALACFGLENRAKAATFSGYCLATNDGNPATRNRYTGQCISAEPGPTYCFIGTSAHCKGYANEGALAASPCNGTAWDTKKRCSFSA